LPFYKKQIRRSAFGTAAKRLINLFSKEKKGGKPPILPKFLKVFRGLFTKSPLNGAWGKALTSSLGHRPQTKRSAMTEHKEQKKTLLYPVVVEGKYDKIKIDSIAEATVILTDGFGVFKNDEKRALIQKLGSRGLIILCDSDGGGRLIRSHLKGMLDGIPVYNLYIPQIAGKEKRKSAPSKAGLLGVEGVSNEILLGILEKFAASHPETVCGECEKVDSPTKKSITKAFLYEMGLNGTECAAENRKKLCSALGLPADMTVNALCEALELISDADEVREIMGKM
jgi:ribonuclease M5